MNDGDTSNPTRAIDLDFSRHVAQRKEQLAGSLVRGAPNYSYATDRRLQQEISSVRAARSLAQFVATRYKNWIEQIYYLRAIAVSPRQYPEIHEMAEQCATRLGIGIPQLFIVADGTLNAFTVAGDDLATVVVLTSGLVDALEDDELLFVIGHESGHIHNRHGVYNTAVELFANPLVGKLAAGVSGSLGLPVGLVKVAAQAGMQLWMRRWSRCAEVTCDRAGLICSGDVAAAQGALVKLVTGGVTRLEDLNLEEYLRQYERVESRSLRIMEAFETHPLIPKRLQAVQAFANCEIFLEWRPKLAPSSEVRSLHETDELCNRILEIA